MRPHAKDAKGAKEAQARKRHSTGFFGSSMSSGGGKLEIQASMKSAMYSTLWVIGVLIAVYVGSYYFFVSPMQVGLGAGGVVVYSQVTPWYWKAPAWLHAPELYQPIQVLDAKILQPAKWRPRGRVALTMGHETYG